MAETRLNNIDTYEGIYPSVFKKVDSTDISTSPFQSYKLWTVISGSSTSSCLPLNAIYSTTELLPALDTELTINDAKNIDGSLQTVTYWSVNHLFYKNKNKPFSTFGPTDLNRTKKYLYQSASILSFPHNKVGDGIKPASFILQTVTRSLSKISQSINLQSDRYGNIYDANIPTASLISECKFYEGFNEGFDVSRFAYRTFSNGRLQFVPGVLATDGTNGNIGYAAQFDSKSMFIVSNDKIPGSYDRNHDYAISFFVSASNDGAPLNQLILGKTGTRKPYQIVLLNNKRVRFFIVGSTPDLALNDYTDPSKCRSAFVTGTTAVTSSWNHIVCQKTGSRMQIYVNGNLEINTDQPILRVPRSPFTESIRFDSNGATHVGGWNPASTASNLNGKLDELRIYNKALSSAEISYLGNRSETGSMLQTNIVGNVFSKQGIAVISSPNYIYGNILQTPYTASYKSTVTTNELNVVTKLDAGDFNMSLNPTLTADNDITYQNFVTGSDFSPYITTIGLYNDAGQLLMVGKLAQPIKKRRDVDMNFLLRIDLDKKITKA
jgi:hypothetical protein